jgi:hypothetical protein
METQLAREIWNTTPESASADWTKLRLVAKNISSGSKAGTTFINHYTSAARIQTKNKERLSFVEFYTTRETRANGAYVHKFLKNNYEATVHNATPKQLFRLYSFYFGSISVFRPAIAIEILNLFPAKTVLDPTMGWGGRMLACVAANVPGYIGIDSNQELKDPYQEMVANLGEHETKIDLIFEDALAVNYAALPSYDMVLTSPPYYNTERYQGQPDRSKSEWSAFYGKLIELTYGSMKDGGHYCMNVSQAIYRDEYVPILGEADFQVPMNKSQRSESRSTEFVYVWVKRTRLRGY